MGVVHVCGQRSRDRIVLNVKGSEFRDETGVEDLVTRVDRRDIGHDVHSGNGGVEVATTHVSECGLLCVLKRLEGCWQERDKRKAIFQERTKESLI